MDKYAIEIVYGEEDDGYIAIVQNFLNALLSEKLKKRH